MRARVTMKVQMDPREAARLGRLAEELGMSEIDLLRSSFALLETLQKHRLPVKALISSGAAPPVWDLEVLELLAERIEVGRAARVDAP